MSLSHRSGFAALIGRPNVGKSTLLNKLVGEKLAIVSPKPQTTRNRILGIVTREEGQVAFLDTPGIHAASGPLNKLMVDVALQAAAECDLVLFLIEAAGKRADQVVEVGEGNRLVLEQLSKLRKPTVLVVNKIDNVMKPLLLPLIDAYQKEFPFAEVVPVSALNGDNLDILFERVLSLMPEAEPMYPPDVLTDQAERTLVAEYIREQVLRHCRQEVPYSAAVVVNDFDESERDTPRPPPKKGKKSQATRGGVTGLVRIDASIYVERDSQKAIVIGKGGAMLKEIGTDARRSIERLLGAHVFLALQVKVEDRWSERPEGLVRMGYTRAH
jgi:GTP-binding protein Era